MVVISTWRLLCPRDGSEQHALRLLSEATPRLRPGSLAAGGGPRLCAGAGLAFCRPPRSPVGGVGFNPPRARRVRQFLDLHRHNRLGGDGDVLAAECPIRLLHDEGYRCDGRRAHLGSRGLGQCVRRILQVAPPPLSELRCDLSASTGTSLTAGLNTRVLTIARP